MRLHDAASGRIGASVSASIRWRLPPLPSLLGDGGMTARSFFNKFLDRKTKTTSATTVDTIAVVALLPHPGTQQERGRMQKVASKH